MANEAYIADINRFCDLLAERIEVVAFGVAKELHTRLVDITPYRTGRARASWNISADVSDDKPAPDIGLGGIDATASEIAQANVFYDSIVGHKSRFTMVNGAFDYYVTNTVHYIERLNGGSSRQAPAGFFESTVFSASTIAQRVVKGLKT